jgi:hypothetical protein
MQNSHIHIRLLKQVELVEVAATQVASLRLSIISDGAPMLPTWSLLGNWYRLVTGSSATASVSTVRLSFAYAVCVLIELGGWSLKTINLLKGNYHNYLAKRIHLKNSGMQKSVGCWAQYWHKANVKKQFFTKYDII